VKNTAYRIFDPVPFTRVTIEDTFWAPRLRVNREKTIPHIFTMLKKTGLWQQGQASQQWRVAPDLLEEQIDKEELPVESKVQQ